MAKDSVLFTRDTRQLSAFLDHNADEGSPSIYIVTRHTNSSTIYPLRLSEARELGRWLTGRTKAPSRLTRIWHRIRGIEP